MKKGSSCDTPSNGCFTCRKGFATYFWRHGQMEVNCKEFCIVLERDSCEKYEPIILHREKAA